MRNHIILVISLSQTVGCQQLECAQGTIERDGRCEPAEVTTNGGMCGPFTMLIGDRCVPVLPPTQCDPATSEATYDPETGIYTCIGTGGGGCDAALACASPSGATKQTICGQIWDFELNMKFAAAGATGARCPTTPTATGPCSLNVTAYDAIAFGMNPATAQPLATGMTYIDDCGRFRLSDIEVPPTPFIGLGFDDAGAMGPTGNTVTVGVATPKIPGGVTRDLEGFIVQPATVQKWATTGGPPLSTGIYAPVYRAHKVGISDPFAPQPGVTAILGTNTAVNDWYFSAVEVTRATIDPAATVTGANGTALVNNVSLANGNTFNGQGGLGPGCQWEPHTPAALAGIVFIQIYRKVNLAGQTCND